MEPTEEIVFDFDGAVLGNFEANGGAPVSFLQFLLNGEKKVLGFFFVDIKFAVAGDPGGPGPDDFHAGKDLADKVADQVGEEDEFAVIRVGRGQGEDPGDAAGHLDEGVAGGFLGPGLGVEDGEVDGFRRSVWIF